MKSNSEILKIYPDWAQELGQKYLSRTINQFILHGNVHDLTTVKNSNDFKFVRLKTFLSEEFFGARDYVMFYDRSSGIYFRDQESKTDFNRALAGRDVIEGTEYAKKMPKDPVRVFSLLEKYFRSRIEQNKSIALIIDYAETIVPAHEAGSSGSEDRNALVFLMKWAHDPLFLAADFTTTLLAENLADLNRTLVQHPYTSEIRLPLPGEESRHAFIGNYASNKTKLDISPQQLEVLAQQTAGLNFVNIEGMMARSNQDAKKFSTDELLVQKKELIEAEAYGLLEFVEITLLDTRK